MFQTKLVEKIKKIHFMFNIFFFFENRAVCEVIWENIVEPDRLQMKIWRMRIAFWITKATNTVSEYLFVYYFSTATMIARTRLNVTLYVPCLSCS